MARLFDDAKNQRYVVGSAVLTTTPFTFHVWCYPDATHATAGEMTLFSVSDTDSNDNFHQLVIVIGDALSASTKAITTKFSTTAGSLTLNAWNACGGVWVSADDRVAWLNGVEATHNTDSRSPVGLDETTVAGIEILSFFNPVSGRLADGVVWNVGLNDNEMIQLANGARADEIRFENIIGGWHLDGKTDERDFSGSGNHLTPTGTGTPAVANHAPIVMPRRRVFPGFTPAPEAAAVGNPMLGASMTGILGG